MSPINRQARVYGFNKGAVVVGAGSFGLATAWSLTIIGVYPVQVIDMRDEMTPPQAATSTPNHIIAPEHGDVRYMDLIRLGVAGWVTHPVLSDFIRRTGYITAATEDSLQASRAQMVEALAGVNMPGYDGHIHPFVAGDAPRWQGFANASASTTASTAPEADILYHLFLLCVRAGVQFEWGQTAYKLHWFDNRCNGVITKNSGDDFHRVYEGEVVIVATGNAIPDLVPEAAGQLGTAAALSMAHIQLTEREELLYRDYPSIHARDLGYICPPDSWTRILKICVEGSNRHPDGRFGDDPPSWDPETISGSDEMRMRRLIWDAFPALVGRPLIEKKTIWVNRTRDDDFLIDRVPGTEGLIVAAGSNGASFKMLPFLGEWVRKLWLVDGFQTDPRWCWRGDLDELLLTQLHYTAFQGRGYHLY